MEGVFSGLTPAAAEVMQPGERECRANCLKLKVSVQTAFSILVKFDGSANFLIVLKYQRL